jgi:hypothetical protein
VNWSSYIDHLAEYKGIFFRKSACRLRAWRTLRDVIESVQHLCHSSELCWATADCNTQLTNFIELSPSWEAASCAPTEELPSILWNPDIHYRVHRNTPFVPILSQIDPVHPLSLGSILILSTHLRLGLPSGLFFLAFPAISCMHSSSSHSCYMPCPSHHLWLDHSNYIWRRVQVMRLQPLVTSSLYDPNILLNTLFSNTLSLCFSLNVRDQVSHPYRTTGKIIVLYIPVLL